MPEFSKPNTKLPPEQEAIRAKCFHPSGTFVEFKKEEIEQSIPDRFEQQVRAYPDRLAVRTKTSTLTYSDLNRIANCLSQEILARCGKGQETVALLLENDAPMIAAMLGVLKAGKIYVPLDSSLPRARLAYILEDSQAKLIVSNGRHRALLKELRDEQGTCVDLDRLDTSRRIDNVGLPIAPDALAWILYTSGSTGQPKGVLQNHRNVLQFIRTYTNNLFLSASDRLSLLFSYVVNGAAHEIFSALLNGASLHPLDVRAQGLAPLARWLVDQEITVYCSVPTVFRHFCELLDGTEAFPKLRLVKLIGEPVLKKDVDLYKKYFHSDCTLVNRYGSTETGVLRWHFIHHDTSIEGNSVPIGYPVEDSEIILLDEKGSEFSPGEVGEIAVKSRYLSPGYWRKPEATEKAFRVETNGDSERIYLTGDLGRMLSDGCLLHLGRKDFQVKIGGQRIETGEIEAALMSLPGIKEAIVMPRADRRGEQRLVAYLLAAEQPGPSAAALRRALAAGLPNYMIPSAFVMLDRFPFAPNGKVNRGALPQPEWVRPEQENLFVPPSTRLETELAAIWAEVLSLDRIGVADDFFDLGGNSLLAMQVISRINDNFRVEIPLSLLFEAPTVAKLAAQIAATQAQKILPEEMADVLAELESLSDDEAERLLARESSTED